MFWNLPQINKKYTNVVETLENKNSGLQVLQVEEKNIPVVKYNVTIKISESKPFNLIEEFILKYATSKLANKLSVNDIAKKLNLDIIFVERYYNDLKKCDAIYDDYSAVRATELGEKLFKKGMIPAQLKTKTFVLYYNQYFKTIYFNLENFLEEENNLFTFIKSFNENKSNIEEVLTLEEANKKRQYFGISNYSDTSNEISNINFEKHSEKIVIPFYEIWIYDILYEKTFCRIWDVNSQKYCEDIAEYVNKNYDYKPIDLDEINDSLPLPTERKNHYKESLKQVIAVEKENDGKIIQKPTHIKILRNSAIKSVFIKELSQAKNRVFIISPWISDKVVDSEMINIFKNLADKGVTTHIGWGIAKIFENEDRKPPQDLINKLNGIKNTKGQQAVFVTWLGNHHDKEIVIDNKIHFLGSFNWLSYKGDYAPRGESVYVVSEPEVVNDALMNMKKIFYEKLFTVLDSEVILDYDLLFSLISLDYKEQRLENRMEQLIKYNTMNNNLSFLDFLIRINKFHRIINRVFNVLLDNITGYERIKIILKDLQKKNKTLFNSIIIENQSKLIALNIINQKKKIIN